MPQTRHALSKPEPVPIVRSLGLGLPSEHRVGAHRHEWPQLVHASEGGLSVETATGSWVVPPGHAVWIPANLEHDLRTTGRVHVRSLYLRPDAVRGLPMRCTVMLVTPLVRELILEVLRRHLLDERVPAEGRLARVLVDLLASTPEAPLCIELPRDPRARRVADAVRRDLSRNGTVAEFARGSGASPRTVERLFVQETGQTFGRWLQRVRALHALERLAAGESVTEAGLSVGYDSTSAFIAMFRRVLGTTPGRYAALRRESGGC